MKEKLAENAEQEVIEFLKDPQEDDAIPLMIRLMQHNRNEYADIMQQQVKWKDEEIARLKAKLRLIQGEIESLYYGKYLPNPDYVLRALFPPDELVKQYQEGKIRMGWELP